MADEDPFSVFSDDDEDHDSDDYDENEKGAVLHSTTSRIAKSLMEQANAKLQVTHSAPISAIKGDLEQSDMEESVDLSHLQRLEFDWPPPAYIGPILLVSALDVGGGRGFVASQHLEPGTLVLVEEPAMNWPDEQLGKKLDLISVKYLLEHPRLVQDMEVFHPTKVNVDHHGDEEDNVEQISKMIQALQAEFEPNQILELVELAKGKGITSKDGSSLESTDILRLFLALRYNGLESGLYRHVAMLNHDYHPNCAKLFPEGNQSYSEVRTTCRVQAGESLTISYVPRIMSHASRRKYLWDQHRFDIGANLKGTELKMELIGNDLPKSDMRKWEDDTVTHRVENTTAELEKMLEDIQDEIDSGGIDSDTWETLKALEQTTLELYNEAIHQLKNDSHILLIPILRVHIETCEQLRKSPSLSTAVQLGILGRQVLNIYRLIPLQVAIHGSDHFDLARTKLDFANGISELLSRSPKKLYDLNIPSLDSFEQWSTMEYHSRIEHMRVKRFYPHDAEQKIRKSDKV